MAYDGIRKTNFNPRSREGSDKAYRASPGQPVISIHAPVKGATHRRQSRGRHASYFNPRSREGSDVHHRRHLVAIEISIHAPVKGATMHMMNTVLPTVFQSTLP